MGPNEREMAQINIFGEVVDMCQLCDLGYFGLEWTFERKNSNKEYVRVRLDRALASAEWYARFPYAKVKHLHAVKSDHSPLLLRLERGESDFRESVEKLFRYEMMWERHGDFRSLVESAWGYTSQTYL
jgi:hypothetical protein